MNFDSLLAAACQRIASSGSGSALFVSEMQEFIVYRAEGQTFEGIAMKTSKNAILQVDTLLAHGEEFIPIYCVYDELHQGSSYAGRALMFDWGKSIPARKAFRDANLSTRMREAVYLTHNRSSRIGVKPRGDSFDSTGRSSSRFYGTTFSTFPGNPYKFKHLFSISGADKLLEEMILPFITGLAND